MRLLKASLREVRSEENRRCDRILLAGSPFFCRYTASLRPLPDSAAAATNRRRTPKTTSPRRMPTDIRRGRSHVDQAPRDDDPALARSHAAPRRHTGALRCHPGQGREEQGDRLPHQGRGSAGVRTHLGSAGRIAVRGTARGFCRHRSKYLLHQFVWERYVHDGFVIIDSPCDDCEGYATAMPPRRTPGLSSRRPGLAFELPQDETPLGDVLKAMSGCHQGSRCPGSRPCDIGRASAPERQAGLERTGHDHREGRRCRSGRHSRCSFNRSGWRSGSVRWQRAHCRGVEEE